MLLGAASRLDFLLRYLAQLSQGCAPILRGPEAQSKEVFSGRIRTGETCLYSFAVLARGAVKG